MNKTSCPICNKSVIWQENKFRPFCSKRCKLIDLGAWADGSYSVPGEKADTILESKNEES